MILDNFENTCKLSYFEEWCYVFKLHRCSWLWMYDVDWGWIRLGNACWRGVRHFGLRDVCVLLEFLEVGWCYCRLIQLSMFGRGWPRLCKMHNLDRVEKAWNIMAVVNPFQCRVTYLLRLAENFGLFLYMF